jgi:hypothetical protein
MKPESNAMASHKRKPDGQPRGIGGRPRKIIDGNKVFAYASLGHSQVEIGRLLGCSASLIARQFREQYDAGMAARVPLPEQAKDASHKFLRLSAAERAAIRLLRKSGYTIKRLAEMFGRTMETIGRTVRGKPPREKHGPRGSRNGKAGLTNTKVGQIKAHLKEGVSRSLLAKYFKVSKRVIDRIASGIYWQHVKPAKKVIPLTLLPDELPIKIRLRNGRLAAAMENPKPDTDPSFKRFDLTPPPDPE